MCVDSCDMCVDGCDVCVDGCDVCVDSKVKVLVLDLGQLQVTSQKHDVTVQGKVDCCYVDDCAVSIQIAAKNLLVCPGLPVESEERCVCVWQLNADG